MTHIIGLERYAVTRTLFYEEFGDLIYSITTIVNFFTLFFLLLPLFFVTIYVLLCKCHDRRQNAHLEKVR